MFCHLPVGNFRKVSYENYYYAPEFLFVSENNNTSPSCVGLNESIHVKHLE